ncbi:putative GTP-binding protein [Lachnospiraceae bacterium TWA4]|nr:putative GTP-binding protein [Lachnospiraceae bacterium TWA4]
MKSTKNNNTAMVGDLSSTPKANRLHIGFFGRRNSGKSSLINAFTNQNVSIVSDVAGTTTDPVYKAMEIHGLGACVIIDTAGFDDVGALGEIRVEKTRLAAQRTDIAVITFYEDDCTEELYWAEYFKKKKTPIVPVVTKSDLAENKLDLIKKIKSKLNQYPLVVSSKTGQGVLTLKDTLIRLMPEDFEAESIFGSLITQEDLVLLVMPQDTQAPKGRLILPQVQSIRELLDRKCIVTCVTADKLEQALDCLKNPPKLIVTDSQVFELVYKKKPKESLLTSFSILFAAYKGDIHRYIQGVKAIDQLTEASKVLIAECCTHAPLTEDIGREKIPRFLRKKVGSGLTVDVVSGTDYPEDLTGYDLIIQCGACMFNRKYVLSRIDRAYQQGVPITNYGVTLAYLNGILDKISLT